MTDETSRNTASQFADTPYEDSPKDWWTEYGGVKDLETGIVHLPRTEHPHCPFECHICDATDEQARRQLFRRVRRALRAAAAVILASD